MCVCVLKTLIFLQMLYRLTPTPSPSLLPHIMYNIIIIQYMYIHRLFNYYSSKYHLFGEDVVSVSFSGDGRHLFTMQRRQPPCLYLATQPKVAATFVDENGGYMNVVSMKSGCFVGARDGVSYPPPSP